MGMVGGRSSLGLTQLCQQVSDAVGDATLGTCHLGIWPWIFECRRSSLAKTGSTCRVGVRWRNEPTPSLPTHFVGWGVITHLHMHFHTGGLPDQRSYGRSGAELELEGAVRGYLEGVGRGWFSAGVESDSHGP